MRLYFLNMKLFLSRIRDIMQPLIDHPPFDLAAFTSSNLPSFYELFTGPAEPTFF
jgi:hypothetical protein